MGDKVRRRGPDLLPAQDRSGIDRPAEARPTVMLATVGTRCPYRWLRSRQPSEERRVQLERRRVLITGGSRGIGAALARGFRAAGADLALVARPSDQLEEVAGAVDGHAYGQDLTDLGALPDLVERVEADGPVDVLVNNAGVAHVGWFLDRTIDEIDRVVTLNLLAPLHLCRLWLPRMIERDRGHVVNVSSMAAIIAPPGLVHYSASKAGLSHATAGLRQDLRDTPIGFTTVHIGSTPTEMDDEARSYGPIRQLAQDSKGRDITPMDDVVDGIVDAVRRDRPEVRFPTAMAPLAAATNLPRRVGRLLFKRSPVKELRPD